MASKRNRPIEVWREIGDLAASQLELVTREQLRELGLSDAAISRMARSGQLYPVFHAVYRVGAPTSSRRVRLRAATLACGPGTVVSHETAACLLGLRDKWPPRIDVIAPVEAGRKIGEIKRRFVPPPARFEVEERGGVPTTSVARTIVDCAGILSRKELHEMIEQAAASNCLNIGQIDLVLQGPRRRGARRLLRALEPWRRYKPGIHIRSRMEAKLLPLLTEWNLPIPETNAGLRIGKHHFEIDFLWRRERLAVETDGRQFHDNPSAGARDSRRNRALVMAGYLIPRFGWEDLRDRPEQTMAEIAHLLATRR